MSSSEKLSGGCLGCSSQALGESMILRNMGLVGSRVNFGRVNFYLFKELVDEIPGKLLLGTEELTRAAKSFRPLFIALHPRESGIKHRVAF